MTEAELADACEANAAAALGHLTRSSGGEVDEAAGAVLAASPDPYCGAFHNAALRTDRRAGAASVLRRADEFFAAQGRGCYILWAAPGRDADLEQCAVAAGAELRRPAAGAPDMLVTAPLAPVRPASNVSVVPVTRTGQVATFGGLVAGAYAALEEPAPAAEAGPATGPGQDGPGAATVGGQPQPPGAALTMFSQPDSLLAPEAYAVIAYLDGGPASCAMLYMTGNVAGVYWVSTLAAARRRGLAELVTSEVANEGFRRGARAAVLQASPMGAPLYRRMGFAEVSHHRRYVRTLK
jgi:ribosomal protein S18 acetylase RimI-like enzyme